MTKSNPNQAAWNAIFEKYDIVQRINEDGSFTISAEQIKEFREPRLMAKFDHAYLLPAIFRNNCISILPTSRGTYSLGRFDVFHTLETTPTPLKNISFDSHFETLDFDNISSETTAISCAYYSKILEDFLEEEANPTVSGRMSSGAFQFQITAEGNTKQLVEVDRAQIEIDAGFEGTESFVLLEAKNHFSDDFIVRQLYYPYRKWQAAIKKRVRNLFLTYSNGIFQLQEYEFLTLNDYNSIRLVRCGKYAICNFQINAQSIQEILAKTQPEIEPPNIPFPQADVFERVINLCELLDSEGALTKAEITENYGFDERQAGYYANACRYLGLVEMQGQGFVLTTKVTAIFKQHIQMRRKFFIEQLLKRKVFNDALHLFFQQAAPPTTEQLITIMYHSSLAKVLSEATIRRRASTVRAWTDWIIEQIED